MRRLFTPGRKYRFSKPTCSGGLCGLGHVSRPRSTWSMSEGMDYAAITVVLACVVLGLVAVGYWSVTLLDVLRVPDDTEFQSGSKSLWVVVLILTGVIGAIIYRLAGQPVYLTAIPISQVDPDRGHKVYLVDGASYVCAADDCEFESTTLLAAKSHESGVQHQQSSPVKPPVGQGPSLASVPSKPSPVPDMISDRAAATPESKTCPDCAEEVRYAARKCRFCGFQFEVASVAD